jgi:hypothetical protein
MLVAEDMSPEEIDQLPRHTLQAKLDAAGSSPHELASSLEGYVWIVGGSGRVRRAEIGPLFGDFLTEVLNAIVPAASGDPTVAAACSGLFVEIHDGIISSAPGLTWRTEHMIMLARGQVDLGEETIDVVVETTPLRGVGLSLGDVINPFTKLSGPLRDPRIVLDPKGTLVEGGAAVATACITVLAKSLWKRWIGADQVCVKMAERAAELRAKRDPEGVPDVHAMLVRAGLIDATATDASHVPESEEEQDSAWDWQDD